jgi:WhiB family redox-sensing transcriptional regulator
VIIEATGWEFELAPWTRQAACGAADHDLFFPEVGQSADPARAICATCPVTAECLDYALRWNIEHGVWGGLTEEERARLPRPGRPRRLPRPHGTTSRYARGCRCPMCADANWRYKQSAPLKEAR